MGSCGDRFGDITASGRTFPLVMWLIAEEVVSNDIWICPPRRSVSAWAEPLYGTCTIFNPSACAKASPARCWVLPGPEEPYEYLSGFALISATNSFTLFAGMSLLMTSTFGTLATSATGARSFSGS